MRRLLGLVLLLAIDVVTSGCGTMQNGRGWGQDATYKPGWARVGQAALDAAKDPEVWAPAIGAALIQIGGAGEEISEWAVDHTPIFGSIEDAEDASDILVDVGNGAFLLSAFAAPSGEDEKQWLWSKTKGLAVGLASLAITSSTTSLIKDAAGRERPNATDDKSFPSGHTSLASVRYTLAYKNFETYDVPDGAKTAARIASAGLTLATGWARVEAAEHYPADVLFGMALGHFIGAFMTDAFLDLDAEQDAAVTFAPVDGGAIASLTLRF